jgi:hypothetical protein
MHLENRLGKGKTFFPSSTPSPPPWHGPARHAAQPSARPSPPARPPPPPVRPSRCPPVLRTPRAWAEPPPPPPPGGAHLSAPPSPQTASLFLSLSLLYPAHVLFLSPVRLVSPPARPPLGPPPACAVCSTPASPPR